MRYWSLILLFQVASTHVLGNRASNDVTWWRDAWRPKGYHPDHWQHAPSHHGILNTATPQPTLYKSPPPPGTSTEHRATSPPAYSQPKRTAKSTSSTMAPAPVPAPTATPIMPNSYRANVLHQHNLHRRNHSAAALLWDSGLTATALEVAQSCVFAHNVTAGGGGYGQNIAAGVPGSQVAKIITNLFYNNEEPWYQGLYGLAQPPMTNFEHWGHFSQVVWNNTKTVGCATVQCPKGVANVGSDVEPYFTVCNYKPPGNYANQYGKNVGKPLGHATVTIS